MINGRMKTKRGTAEDRNVKIYEARVKGQIVGKNGKSLERNDNHRVGT